MKKLRTMNAEGRTRMPLSFRARRGGRGICFCFPMLALLLLCAPHAHAQIAFDSGTNGHGANVASVTFSHSCSGSNRILFVGVYVLQAGGAPAVNSVTYGGANLTLMDRIVNGNHGSELWYLVAPATGANDVVVTMGVSTLRIWPVAVSFTGAHQGAPEASNAASGTATAASVAVTTLTANSWVVDILANGHAAASPTIGVGQTPRAASLEGAVQRGLSSTEGPVSPAGPVTMSWTLSGSAPWVIVAAAFKPAAALAPVRRPPVWTGTTLVMPLCQSMTTICNLELSDRFEAAGIVGPSRSELAP